MQALVLCGFSVANYALLYVTSILLARTLSVADFDDYNVAVSSVLVLTSLATLGLEKYALRCLPAWHNHQDWARSSGFLQFSRRLILVTGLVLVVLFCVTLELTLTLRGAALSRGDRHRGDVPARDRYVSIHPGGGSRLWRGN